MSTGVERRAGGQVPVGKRLSHGPPTCNARDPLVSDRLGFDWCCLRLARASPTGGVSTSGSTVCSRMSRRTAGYGRIAPCSLQFAPSIHSFTAGSCECDIVGCTCAGHPAVRRRIRNPPCRSQRPRPRQSETRPTSISARLGISRGSGSTVELRMRRRTTGSRADRSDFAASRRRDRPNLKPLRGPFVGRSTLDARDGFSYYARPTNQHVFKVPHMMRRSYLIRALLRQTGLLPFAGVVDARISAGGDCLDRDRT